MEEIKKGPPRAPMRPRSAKQDDSIMGTNNSSIVSKRSVERIYYPNEPHYFRYFVKKPQRRSPLINRGYWLRMKAIDHVISQFLSESSDNQKVVLNLGCGYDPVFWQCFSRYPKTSKDVIFVDVDYKDLMLRKREMVKSTKELNEMLTATTMPETGSILLNSDQYVQIGCDLRELKNLETTLASIFDLDKSLILFVAEVSITYMDVKTSDALIKWCGSLPHARFCLLEQLLPEGPDHPFAKTMLAHFDKLGTPLRPVLKYPRTSDQETRFKIAGWPEANAQNLWELWSSTDFLSPEERIALDAIEPFDEWEEFALFGCHYVFLLARNETLRHVGDHIGVLDEREAQAITVANITPKISYSEYPKVGGCRRFCSPLLLRGSNRQNDLVGNFGGMGLNNRVNSCDAHADSDDENLFYKEFIGEGPPARMCHTLTDLGETGSLLVGGRTHPDNALSDCWLYHKWTNTWERVDDIPSPRYRHSTLAISMDSVLVIGGKRDSQSISSDCFIWNRRKGWTKLTAVEREHQILPLVFGAIMIADDSHGGENYQGLLAGGMTGEGIVSVEVWRWSISMGDKPFIRFKSDRASMATRTFARFGASISQQSSQTFITGGIIRDNLIPVDEEICIVTYGSSNHHTIIQTMPVKFSNAEPRPLLIGSTTFLSREKLLIMGGGSVCFSFGTFWNRGCYTLLFEGSKASTNTKEDRQAIEPVQSQSWKFNQTVGFGSSGKSAKKKVNTSSQNIQKPPEPVSIPRVKVSSDFDFSAIMSAARPVIIEGLDLGTCTASWSSEYLMDLIGQDREVIVHKASTSQMDFQVKNFDYVKMPFGDFIKAIEADEKLYLRSLSAKKPSEIPAKLSDDFSAIANDFKLPPEFSFVVENAHSSPLRISGPINMWLHYDVMSNVLCQIRGKKRLLLFPPTDVQYFDFAPGASSSSIDAFNMLSDASYASTHPYEALMNPGDVLFLPSLWLHTAKPLEGVSVSVNIFFRGLSNGYAAGKDVYGNRDLQAYEKGRQDIAKISRSFDSLPVDVRKFYLLRLADELGQKAGSG